MDECTIRLVHRASHGIRWALILDRGARDLTLEQADLFRL